MTNFKDLLYSHKLINTTNKFDPINVTAHPSKFPVDKVIQAQELQKTINTLFYKAMKDSSTFNIETEEEMYNMLLKMKRTNTCPKPTLIYIRTDYLLNEDHVLKQVEVNTIAVSFFALNMRLNAVHALLNDNVWLPDNISQFISMVELLRDFFIKKNDGKDFIALLVDDHTDLNSKNFFEKKDVICELKKTGIVMLHVTVQDVKERG